MTQEQVKKPNARILNADGNVFNLLGICAKALRNAGEFEEAKEMQEKVFKADSYDHALQIMGEYCNLC